MHNFENIQHNFYRMQSVLAEYPILQDRIIEAMLNRLVHDQVFNLSEIQVLIREKAIRSQTREGLNNPFIQEGPAGWENRLSRVRANLIVEQYATQYSFDEFEETVDTIVQNRESTREPNFFWHNVEFAPLDSIFEQAFRLERLAAGGDIDAAAALDGAKTALIRRCLSDHLEFISVAKKQLKIQDLLEVSQKVVGHGSIGGKSAGLILSRYILQHSEDEEIREAATIKDSYFVGADEFQTFLATNNMLDLYDLRYLPDQVRWDRFTFIHQRFLDGTFSANIVDALEQIIREIDGRPFIVRSSSLLEDSYQASIIGIYESIVVPNQGTREEGLLQLQNAIRELYSQVFNPQAIQYREKKKFDDYPERMGILIQIIRGHQIGNYYFPDLSGFAVSKSVSRWSPNEPIGGIDAGYTRFVVGLGSHALHRHSSDCPAFISLNESDGEQFWENRIFRNASQRLISVINLKTNRAELIDIEDIPLEKYAFAGYAAQNEQGDRLVSVRRTSELDHPIINYHKLIHQTNFNKIIRSMLTNLDAGFGCPTAIEFSILCDFEKSSNPSFKIQIDKCRPIVSRLEICQSCTPPPKTDHLFLETHFNTINRTERGIEYICVVDPKGSYNRDGLQYWLRTLNRELNGKKYVLFSNRRFGVYDNGAGLRIKFADIQNATAVIEVSNLEKGIVHDYPCGTQFYSNMIEIGIAYVPVFLGTEGTFVDWEFFEKRKNVVDQFVELPAEYRGMIRLYPTREAENLQSMTFYSSKSDGKTCLCFEE